MKKWLLGFLFNIVTGLSFVMLPFVLAIGRGYGIIYGVFCWALLDFNSYIQNKLDYPNNIFIKH